LKSVTIAFRSSADRPVSLLTLALCFLASKTSSKCCMSILIATSPNIWMKRR